MATSLKAVVGNTAPQYQITCERDDGTIIDLTNTTVTMNLYRGKTKTNTGHEACVIIGSPTNGVMGWTPQTGDLPSPGRYKGDVTVTYTNGTHETLYSQFLLKVRNTGG